MKPQFYTELMIEGKRQHHFIPTQKQPTQRKQCMCQLPCIQTVQIFYFVSLVSTSVARMLMTKGSSAESHSQQTDRQPATNLYLLLLGPFFLPMSLHPTHMHPISISLVASELLEIITIQTEKIKTMPISVSEEAIAKLPFW